jgi:hypothetical protein
MSEDITENTPINLSFKEALNALEAVTKDSFVNEVWIPSLRKNITIKEINAKQQKELLESAIDSSVYKSSFSKTFYDILLSNASEPKDALDAFNIADKMAVSLALREQISPTIKIEFNENLSENIELKNISNKLQQYSLPEPITFETIKNNVSIKVETSLPTILSEVNFEAFLSKNKKKTDDVEEVKSLIANAFLTETAKYIKSISIDSQDLNFQSFAVSQKIQFVEKLPATIIQQIIDIITKWKKELENILTITSSNGENTKLLDIDSLLFLTN